ncbi:DUF6153 family protein [Nonomuraea sp. NPDC005501]|uniref:DUF6153 family protein n=1 Tax=Nonomuraea sp. NPDC005501 TaxID=3156884 RepID=UPI0033BB7FBE
MGGSARRLPLSWLRWLLPVVLALGVWGMHTLGHVSSHHGQATTSSSHAPADADKAARTAPGETMPIHRTTIEPIPSADASGGLSAGSGSPPWLDPTVVCLAVLSSVVVLLLMAAQAAAWRWTRKIAGSTTWAGGVARSPPRRLAPPLASLSVMRT